MKGLPKHKILAPDVRSTARTCPNPLQKRRSCGTRQVGSAALQETPDFQGLGRRVCTLCFFKGVLGESAHA